jgi:hypothetical protein
LPTPASPLSSTTCGRPCSARSRTASSRCSSSALPMNAELVNPPAMAASMAAASSDGNRLAQESSTLDGVELDHVLVAVTDLAAAAREIDARFGLASVEGGRLPGSFGGA